MLETETGSLDSHASDLQTRHRRLNWLLVAEAGVLLVWAVLQAVDWPQVLVRGVFFVWGALMVLVTPVAAFRALRPRFAAPGWGGLVVALVLAVLATLGASVVMFYAAVVFSYLLLGGSL